MKCIIHGESTNGNEDSLPIEAETIEEIRKIAADEVSVRGWHNCWSEMIGE